MANTYTESKKRAILKYQAKTVTIQIRVDKDKREQYKTVADRRGVSLTQLIKDLLDNEVGDL